MPRTKDFSGKVDDLLNSADLAKRDGLDESQQEILAGARRALARAFVVGASLKEAKDDLLGVYRQIFGEKGVLKNAGHYMTADEAYGNDLRALEAAAKSLAARRGRGKP